MPVPVTMKRAMRKTAAKKIAMRKTATKKREQVMKVAVIKRAEKGALMKFMSKRN